MTSIRPFLWFDTDLAEAIAFYTSIFPDVASPDTESGAEFGPVFMATIGCAGSG